MKLLQLVCVVAFCLFFITTTSAQGNVRFADQFTSIRACVVAAGANGTCVVPANFSQTISSQNAVSIGTSQTTLRCEPGANIIRAAGGNFAMITITGSDDVVQDCTIDGANVAGSSNVGIWVNDAIRARIEGNTVKNQNGGLAAIYLSGASGTKISRNSVRSNANAGVFGERNTTQTTVEHNLIDGSATTQMNDSSVMFHSTVTGQTVNDLIISGNQIVGSSTGSTGFCVEVGSFNGDMPHRVVIANNTCKMSASSVAGGYSVSGAQTVSVTGNTFETYDGSSTYGIAAYELVNVVDASLTGNAANGIGAGAASAISCSQSCNRVTITGNTVEGFGSATGAAGIVLSTSVANGAMADNTVVGNTITFPPLAAGRGIWLQCNATATSCTGNAISSNHIVGSQNGNASGVVLENDSGTTDRNLVGPNEIRFVGTGYVIGAGVTNTHLMQAGNFVGVLNQGTNTVFF